MIPFISANFFMTILLMIIYIFVGDINNFFLYHLIYAGYKFIHKFFYDGVKNHKKVIC